MPDPANPVIFYDGVCGLCNRLVRFVLKHDAAASFRFASLQGDYAAQILKRRADDIDTVYVVETSGARPKSRSDAVISILRTLGGFWRAVATILQSFPKPLRDRGYNIVARHRYRIFGKYETCPLPEKKYEDRFLAK